MKTGLEEGGKIRPSTVLARLDSSESLLRVMATQHFM